MKEAQASAENLENQKLLEQKTSFEHKKTLLL